MRDGEAGAGAAERLVRPVAVEDALRLAEADDHRLLGLGHDREGAADQDQQQDRDDAERDRVANERLIVACLPAAAAAGCAAALDFGQRQIGRHARRLDDRRVDPAQDPLHRLIIHAPPGHFGRGAIFGIDLLERRRLALRAGGQLQRIGAGVVHVALRLLLRRRDFEEGLVDRRRRHRLVDRDALDLRRRRHSRRAICCMLCSTRLLDLGAAGADRVVEADPRDHRAHRAFGDLADGLFGIGDLEQVELGIR